MSYYNDKPNLSKPNLSVYKAINKAFITWDIKVKNDLPVYYAWSKNIKPKIKKLRDGSYILKPFVLVDYDKHTREWNIVYYQTAYSVRYATVDDVTGKISTI